MQQRAVRALSALILVVFLAPIAMVESAGPAAAATLPAPSLTAPPASFTATANPIFSWGTVTGAATYHFQLSTQSNMTSPTYDIVTPNSYATPPFDMAQTTWYWRVASRDVNGTEGAFSNTRSLTKVLPDAPTGLVPADGKVFSFPNEPVSLGWTPMPGAKLYQVEISNNALFTPPLELSTSTFEPTLTLTNVQTIGQTFYWHVRAISPADLPTQFSASRTYSLSWTTAPTQTAPADSLATPIEQIDFAWNALPGAVSYDIQVSPNVDFTSGLVVNTNLLATKYSPATTLQNGAYYWRVRGRNASSAAGIWSPIHQFVKAWPAPDAPPFNRVSLLTPANNDFTVGEPTFTWSPVRLASRYEVQFSVDVNFSPGSISSCVTNHTIYTPFTSCFDPAPNTVWYWRVRPLDDQGGINGLFSSVRTFQWFPHANASQLVVPTLPANGASTAQPVLTWNLVRNIGHYRVVVLNKDLQGVAGGDTYANQFVPNGLDKTQGPFSWYVQTLDSNGRVGPIPGSGQWRTFNLIDPPTTVGSLGTPTSVPTAAVHGPLLTWPAITNATNYKIWKAPQGSPIYQVLASGLTTTAYRHPSVDLSPGNWSYFVEAYNSSNVLLSTSSIGSFTSNTLGALPDGKATMIHSVPPTNAYGSPSDDGCPIQTAQVDCAPVLDTPTFAWNPVDYADHYQLVLATDPNFTNIIRTYLTGQSQLTPTESLVDSQAGQAIYWYAVPCSGGVCAPQPNSFAGDPNSPVWFFRKQSRAIDLLTPANNATLANQITFTWKDYLLTNQDAVDGLTKVPEEALGYRVEISLTPDFANIIDTSPIVDGTTYTATGLYPEGPIYWRVQAVDATGNLLTWSSARMLTKSSPVVTLVAPANNAAVSLEPTFSWTPQAYAYVYQIEVYAHPDQPLAGGNVVYSVSTAASAATPLNAFPAGTYGWRVRRLDGAGRPGPWSADTNAGLRIFTYNGPATTLLQPGNNSVVTDNSLLMTWTPVNAAQYRIDIATDSAFANLKEQLGTVMTAYASPATYPNGTYYWRVLSLDGQGNTIATSATFSFLKDAGSGGDFYPLAPARLLDTRTPADAPALQPAQARYLQVTGHGGVPATGVSAIVANDTVVSPTAGSWLTVWPAGGPLPAVSNLNYTPGQTVPNLVTVKVSGNGQIGLQNQFGTANVIVDVVGYYSDGTLDEAPDGSRFTATVSPTRILDTRTTVPPKPLGPGDANLKSVQVAGIGGVPSAASAVVMNVTAVTPTTGSWLTIWPHGVSEPLASNLNYSAGQTVPNLVIMKVGDQGKVDMVNAFGSVDVIFDVVGYFQNTPSPPAGSRFRDIAPGRLADTRVNFPSGGRLGSNSIRSFQIAGQSPLGGGVAPVPATGAVAVVLNVTVVSPSGGGYATVYPSDATQPLASNLNFVGGQVVPNLVTARLGADGAVKVFTTTATDVIIDVVGWYAVPPS